MTASPGDRTYSRRMDIAVVVNLRARRASERVLRTVERVMPSARVLPTRSIEGARDLAEELHHAPPDLVVSAGGDGTAVTLLTALRDAAGRSTRAGTRGAAPVALLPLGTGNGWARALGATSWRTALAHLGRASLAEEALPLRRSDLIEVGGQVAPFAGSGWDAIILEDYRRFKTRPYLPRALREGVPGYALSLASSTIPRQVMFGKPLEVELTNLGDEALAMSPDGQPVRIEGAGPGTVLYRGPVSVCGCAITPEYGFGFRAFPFAGTSPGRFAARIYAGSVMEAVSRVGQLWRGAWPLPNDHQWLLSHCRMSFSRPVPFQVGGDVREVVTDLEYRIASEKVDLLDWRAVSRRAA